MENNENNCQELEEMRAQLSVLKNKLDKESIINERLLRDAMKHKANVINANAWGSVFASVLAIVLVLTVFPKEGFSWWLIGCTILMMLFCIFTTWKFHKNVNSKTMNGDLLTVAKVMKKLKEDYVNWLKYDILMAVFWLAWLITEYCFIAGNWKLCIVAICGPLIGGTIGGYIGIRMHKSVIHNAEDIIRQIEEE